MLFAFLVPPSYIFWRMAAALIGVTWRNVSRLPFAWRHFYVCTTTFSDSSYPLGDSLDTVLGLFSYELNPTLVNEPEQHPCVLLFLSIFQLACFVPDTKKPGRL